MSTALFQTTKVPRDAVVEPESGRMRGVAEHRQHVIAVAAERSRDRRLDDRDQTLSDLVEAKSGFDASIRQQCQAPRSCVRHDGAQPRSLMQQCQARADRVATVRCEPTRSLPQIAVSGGIEHFNETVGRSDLLAEIARRAGFAQIEPAEFDRIDACRVGKPGHLAFHRIRHLIGAEAAKSTADAVVGVGEPSAVAHIGNFVGPAGMFEARFEHARAERSIRASVEKQIHLLGDQAPGIVAAGAHADAHRIAHAAGEHRLGAVEMQADRTAALERQ